jgi:Uma2 family endonuclease
VDREKSPFPFGPDIAVEVLSESELAVENHRKTNEYLAAGAQEVWVVDHANGEVFVHTSANTRPCKRATSSPRLSCPASPSPSKSS